MEKPAQMRAVALPWSSGVRPRCHTCRRRVQRARQIDGTVIHFCEAGCRSELGLPFSAEALDPCIQVGTSAPKLAA